MKPFNVAICYIIYIDGSCMMLWLVASLVLRVVGTLVSKHYAELFIVLHDYYSNCFDGQYKLTLIL